MRRSKLNLPVGRLSGSAAGYACKTQQQAVASPGYITALPPPAAFEQGAAAHYAIAELLATYVQHSAYHLIAC